MGPGYLRDHLFTIISTSPIRRGTQQALSAKEFHLMGPKRQSFSARAPTFWNIIPPEVNPIFYGLQKPLKTFAKGFPSHREPLCFLPYILYVPSCVFNPFLLF